MCSVRVSLANDGESLANGDFGSVEYLKLSLLGC